MSDAALDRLRQTWRDHVAPDDDVLLRVVERHREPHRGYHGVAHLDHVVHDALELASRLDVDELDVVAAAACFHDSIYTPASSTNEADSAELASVELAALGWSKMKQRRVAAMIEGTTHHRDPPDDASAALFDADLAVLGAAPGQYEHYRSGVRTEYRHVDDDAWRSGRAAVLRSFLDRRVIYATAEGRARWETRARRNLADELASLTT
ncbi:MAG: metal-dependent phosphohydrolase [Ilumatobacter sp.]